MKRSLVLGLVPAALLGVLLGCGARDDRQAALEAERAAADAARKATEAGESRAVEKAEKAPDAKGDLAIGSYQLDPLKDGRAKVDPTGEGYVVASAGANVS